MQLHCAQSLSFFERMCVGVRVCLLSSVLVSQSNQSSQYFRHYWWVESAGCQLAPVFCVLHPITFSGALHFGRPCFACGVPVCVELSPGSSLVESPFSVFVSLSLLIAPRFCLPRQFADGGAIITLPWTATS